MLAVNLGIATLIPIAWGLMAVVHQVRPRWLSSVQPRIRWRYLLGCLAIAAVVLNGVMLLSTLVGSELSLPASEGLLGLPGGDRADLTDPGGRRGDLLPRLSACRRSAAWSPVHGSGWSSPRWSSPCCTGSQNLPLFVDRLAFGLLAALLVWRTGGLEAGIAAHVVNNVFAYVIAGLTTSIAALKAIKGIGWVDAAFDVGGFALFAVVGVPGLSRLDEAPNSRLLSAEQRAAADWRTSRIGLGGKGGSTVRFLLVPRRRAATRRQRPVGYGVIGSPTDSGSVSLGSSPSTPARQKLLIRPYDKGVGRLPRSDQTTMIDELGPRCVAA